MKICANCKYCIIKNHYGFNHYCKLSYEVDKITGKKDYVDCYTSRNMQIGDGCDGYKEAHWIIKLIRKIFVGIC